MAVITFRSKVDAWLVILGWAAIIVPVGALVALSVNRLRICHSGGKSVMISPADNEAFIRTLGLDARAQRSPRE